MCPHLLSKRLAITVLLLNTFITNIVESKQPVNKFWFQPKQGQTVHKQRYRQTGREKERGMEKHRKKGTQARSTLHKI